MRSAPSKMSIFYFIIIKLLTKPKLHSLCHLIEYVREIHLEMKDKKPHKISR